MGFVGFAQARAALVDAGLEPADVGWGEDAPELRWAVREVEVPDAGDAGDAPGGAGRRWLLGGRDHGVWLTWREFPADVGGTDELVKALWELRRRGEPAPFPRTLAETAQAATLGAQMMDRAAGWAGGVATEAAVDVLPASEVKVGTPLDHVGDESGHVLHLFGTPWERRALPEEARGLPLTGYLLGHVLSVGCRAERVQPAHGQPGGAWRVVLDRPIAAHLESGALRPFVPRDR